MRVLVIDDSRAMRAILASMLKARDYEVFEAADGKQALEVLKQHGAMDVAMVDWNMPEMNGMEFVQAVRADHGYDAMRLIMVTTETEMAQVSNALVAGANEYIMKPFTRDIVLGKLELLRVAAG
jgi:two-component system chemotaxis response regulator CheY